MIYFLSKSVLDIAIRNGVCRKTMYFLFQAWQRMLFSCAFKSNCLEWSVKLQIVLCREQDNEKQFLEVSRNFFFILNIASFTSHFPQQWSSLSKKLL